MESITIAIVTSSRLALPLDLQIHPILCNGFDIRSVQLFIKFEEELALYTRGQGMRKECKRENGVKRLVSKQSCANTTGQTTNDRCGSRKHLSNGSNSNSGNERIFQCCFD
mmetsp:Transcript_1120/g.2001  ORF Transcript_1120/g.2001 Transcript_1120/m.2001 type:complete len:111 (+) Transcript_1120:417-749(+)